MSTIAMLGDVAVAAARGLVATNAIEPVTTTLYERASEADPGVPYRWRLVNRAARALFEAAASVVAPRARDLSASGG